MLDLDRSPQFEVTFIGGEENMLYCRICGLYTFAQGVRHRGRVDCHRMIRNFYLHSFDYGSREKN